MPVRLKSHQSQVVKYMKESNARGIILFHGLGSGKTITSIAISKIYDSKVLIIVPASMRTQWVPELQKMEVNLKNYEHISPRHFLEWNAMKYYKYNMLNFYEIGERYYDQNDFKPTNKEISISEFKEKFGSNKYPKPILKVQL